MRIIFLDVDGVLVTGHGLKKGLDFRTFDPECVQRLEEVLSRTGAKIVLSSTWRITHTCQEMTEKLRTSGAPSANVISATPRNGGFRGNEIEEWLDTFNGNIQAYAIVDDDSDMKPHQVKHLVKTHCMSGLQDTHRDQLVQILRTDS